MTKKYTIHQINASKLFGVHPAFVTREQMHGAKMWMHSQNYSSGSIKMGLVTGHYPQPAIEVSDDPSR